MLLDGSWPILGASWRYLRVARAFTTVKMECLAEGAGPVLAHLSLNMHAYAQDPGSTPSTTGGGRRIAHAHSAGPGVLD